MNTVTLVPRPEDRAVVNRAAALLKFASKRLQASILLRAAANIPGITEQDRAQALAAADLVGIRLHKTCGAPHPIDAEQCRDDLYAIARIVDRLIETLGHTAKHELGLSDEAMTLFREQLLGALDGNATHALTELADAMREDMAVQRCTTRRSAPRE